MLFGYATFYFELDKRSTACSRLTLHSANRVFVLLEHGYGKC